MVSIKKFANEENLPELKKSGHKLFGTAAGVGLEILAGMARQLENLDLANTEAIQHLLIDLEKEIGVAERLINEHLKVVFGFK